MDKKVLRETLLGKVAQIENGERVRKCLKSEDELSKGYALAPVGSSAEKWIRAEIMAEAESCDFLQRLNYFICAPADSLLRKEVLDLLLEKTEEIEELSRVLEAAHTEEEAGKIGDKMVPIAKSFEDWSEIRLGLARGRFESDFAIEHMAELAKTSEQWKEVWDFLPYDSPHRKRGLAVIAEAVR